MIRFPTLKPTDVVRVLKKLGFTLRRQTGSHMFFAHEDGRTTVVPHHHTDIGRGLMRKILTDIELDKEEFRKHL